MYFKVRARNCIFKENVLSSFKLIFFFFFGILQHVCKLRSVHSYDPSPRKSLRHVDQFWLSCTYSNLTHGFRKGSWAESCDAGWFHLRWCVSMCSWLLVSNRPDQPVNLSPLLSDDGPTGTLISLSTLGKWEIAVEPVICANKIWEKLVVSGGHMPSFLSDARTSCRANQVDGSHPGQTVWETPRCWRWWWSWNCRRAGSYPVGLQADPGSAHVNRERLLSQINR